MQTSVLLSDADRGYPDLEERVIDLEGGLRVAMQAVTDLRAQMVEVRGHISSLQTIYEWIGRVYAWMRNSARHFPWH